MIIAICFMLAIAIKNMAIKLNNKKLAATKKKLMRIKLANQKKAIDT